ncbi:MAG: penicillin-binding protein 2 [Gammaproteobacteria bacterium]|nr:MAG: penicillin-binding protein 2 [Gammaproteobacteria bacterium]
MKFVQDLKRDEREIKSLKERSRIIFLFISIMFCIGLFKILQLSILDNTEYLDDSDKNRIIEMPIHPARGLIKLQDGLVVAENIVSKDLFIKTEFLDSAEKELDYLRTNIANDRKLTYSDVKNYKKDEKVLLLGNLSSAELAKFELSKEFMPHISLEISLRRYLPQKNLFSHVIGHLGRLSSEEKTYLPRFEYPLTSFLGKVGLEKVYEKELKGFPGLSLMEVDVYGKKIRELERNLPLTPKDITLSLNLKLQNIARTELANRKGAIIALDPNTGFIKAMVSSPDYNPNTLNGSEIGSSFEDYLREDSPFFNRAISGSYPPASTIKPFVGLLGLEEGVITEDTKIEDKGFFQLKEDGRRYRGWKEDGHGQVNLNKAIVESSDVYFYELSSQLTIDRISKFLSAFGFGKFTEIDLYSEAQSILPTRNWKLGNIGEPWFVGDTINIGIGQGYITSTPMQLLSSISAIATKGKIFKPKIVSKIGSEPLMPELLHEIKIKDQQHWNIIEKSMIKVIQSWNGTAHNLYTEGGVVIAGKTGTAQIKSLTDQDLTVREEYQEVRDNIEDRDHALFASYGPIPNPNIAVVVIVENGESGSAVAAPIAKKMIEAYQKITFIDEQ